MNTIRARENRPTIEWCWSDAKSRDVNDAINAVALSASTPMARAFSGARESLVDTTFWAAILNSATPIANATGDAVREALQRRYRARSTA